MRFFRSAVVRLVTVLFVTSFCFAQNNAATLIGEGHYKQGRIAVEQQLANNPSNVAALVLKARLYLAYNEYENAIKLLKSAIARDSANSDAHVYLAEAYGQKIEHIAVFAKIGMAENIRKEGELAVAADPQNLDALESLMEFHIEAPGSVGGSKDKARELAARIAVLDPIRGNFAYAEIAVHEKRFADEKKFLLKALAADPKSYDALIAVARLFLRDPALDYGAAADYATKAIKVDSTRARAYSLLAQSYAGQGQFEQLQQLLSRAEAQVPDDFSPFFYASKTLLGTGSHPALAETYLRKYLAQEPEGEAPTLAEAHWRLGQALEQQGRKEDAVREIQDALRIKPDLKAARKDLDRLTS
jgi:tetratricopeptide (TPR) repeat protein